MTMVVSDSWVNSRAKQAIDCIMAEHNRRSIANVFENAKYNKEGFAEATHYAARMVDKLGKTQKVAFLPKVQPKTLLSKLGGCLKNLIKFV